MAYAGGGVSSSLSKHDPSSWPEAVVLMYMYEGMIPLPIFVVVVVALSFLRDLVVVDRLCWRFRSLSSSSLSSTC